MWLYDRWEIMQWSAQTGAHGGHVIIHSFQMHVGPAPVWLLILLTSLLPLARGATLVRRLSGRKRPRDSRCRHCGYDLRATPDRCPECGAVASGA